MSKANILGVKIDDITMDEALTQVEEWLKKPGKHYIVTPNPEFVMAAQKDERFRKLLNDADLSVPDGTGLKFSGKVKNTIYGTDLMEKLVTFAAEKGFTIGLLGGKNGVAEKAGECLKQKYPKLKVAFAESGGKVDEEGKVINDERLKINEKNHQSLIVNHKSLPEVDLLFVAFGHRKQEKWIANNLPKLPVKVAMGVGGAFDYISANVPRAPLWIRNLGFEWLFRLLIQPWRIKRQLALLKYLWLLTQQR